MLTIRSKIIIAYTCVFGILLTGLSVIIYQSVKETAIAKLDARMESHADKIQTELEEQYDQKAWLDTAAIYSLRTEGISSVRIQLFDSSGAVILSDSALARYASLANKDFRVAPVQKDFLRIGEETYRTMLQSVEVENIARYILRMAVPMDDILSDLRHLRLLFLLGIPVTLFITAMMAAIITRTAFRPITAMAETANAISAQNLEQRLALPEAHDEVRLLGETLNRMIDRIDHAFRSQRQFITDASHEFRTPLTIVSTELQLAQSIVQEESAAKSIQTSLSEIDRLARMTDSLLLLSKLDASQIAPNRETVRLDELLIECTQRMQPLAAKRQIDIRLRIDEAVEVCADAGHLKSAILNLMDNAIRYSFTNTSVSATLVLNREKTSRVHLAIEDNGPGIAAEELPRIFQRFHRSESIRSQVPGNGLGLAIAKQLVELHGGTVLARSEPGKGSCFTIELPVRKEGIGC